MTDSGIETYALLMAEKAQTQQNALYSIKWPKMNDNVRHLIRAEGKMHAA